MIEQPMRKQVNGHASTQSQQKAACGKSALITPLVIISQTQCTGTNRILLPAHKQTSTEKDKHGLATADVVTRVDRLGDGSTPSQPATRMGSNKNKQPSSHTSSTLTRLNTSIVRSRVIMLSGDTSRNEKDDQ